MRPSNLEKLRLAAGLKRHELAVELGLDPKTIWRWETVAEVPRKHREGLADRFGVSVAYLMGWSDDNGDEDDGDGEEVAA